MVAAQSLRSHAPKQFHEWLKFRMKRIASKIKSVGTQKWMRSCSEHLGHYAVTTWSLRGHYAPNGFMNGSSFRMKLASTRNEVGWHETRSGSEFLGAFLVTTWSCTIKIKPLPHPVARVVVPVIQSYAHQQKLQFGRQTGTAKTRLWPAHDLRTHWFASQAGLMKCDCLILHV